MDTKIIDIMIHRKSIRKYTDQAIEQDILDSLLKASVSAPFAGQTYSILMKRDRKKNPFSAPLFFIFCVDSYKMEKIMEKRGWKMRSNDISFMLLGIQDAAYAAENMVIAAESFGMGSCYHGWIPSIAERIKEAYKLPDRVFPLVGLTVGYPAENPPTRPRFPIEFTVFEDKYSELTDEMIDKAMQVMDDGYLAQDYYRKANYMVKLEEGMEETFTFENYSWTEHISRKYGLWHGDINEILEQLKACGFALGASED